MCSPIFPMPTSLATRRPIDRPHAGIRRLPSCERNAISSAETTARSVIKFSKNDLCTLKIDSRLPSSATVLYRPRRDTGTWFESEFVRELHAGYASRIFLKLSIYDGIVWSQMYTARSVFYYFEHDISACDIEFINNMYRYEQWFTIESLLSTCMLVWQFYFKTLLRKK